MTTMATPQTTAGSAGPGRFTAAVVAEAGDQRTVFRGVDRHTYEQLSQAAGEGQPVRVSFDGKDLEIMVTGNAHERFKELLGTIVRAVATGRDLEFLSCGQTTWKSAARGLEADLSYYFDPLKVRAAAELLARGSTESADFPRPDLAIEIDLSTPQVDRPAIYRELGVAEVWRLVKGDTLVFERLQADGTYAPVEESPFLGLRPEQVLRWLTDAATEREASWSRRLNQWALGLGTGG